MQEVTNFKNINFKSWNNIHDAEGHKISSFWGKTFFYCDEKQKKIFAERLSFIGLIFRALFGYKKHLNRANFWKGLKFEKIVDEKQNCPASKVFRKTVGNILATRQKTLPPKKKLSTTQVIYRNCLFANIRRGYNGQAIQLFEENKVNINVINKSGESALTAALKIKNYKIAHYLIEKKAEWGATPQAISLHRLISSEKQYSSDKKEDVICSLIKSGKFNLTKKKGTRGYTLLHEATAARRQRVVKALLESPVKEELINAKSYDGNTPFQLACKKINFSSAELLFNKGATVSKGDFAGLFPRRFEAILDFSTSRENLVSSLIDSGKFNLTETIGDESETLLHQAVRVPGKPGERLVQKLLDNKTTKTLLNVKNRYGTTPLEFAYKNKLFASAKLLLNAGATPSRKALISALFCRENEKRYPPNNFSIDKKLAVVDLFTARGLKLEGNIGWEMLNLVAESGNKALVEKVLNKFKNLTAPNMALRKALGPVPKNWRPITQQARIAIAELLIQRGANLDKIDLGSRLKEAVEAGEEHIIRFIFTAKPDFVWQAEPPQRNGKTLLQIAEKNGHQDIVALLKAELKKAHEEAYGKPEEPKQDGEQPEQ